MILHFYKLQQDHGSIFAGLALLISPFSTGDLIIAALPWKLYPATLQSRKAILCLNDTGLRLGGAIKDCFIVPQNWRPKGSCLKAPAVSFKRPIFPGIPETKVALSEHYIASKGVTLKVNNQQVWVDISALNHPIF